MKLTKKQENELAKKLRCICGACDCSPSSRTCPYWKNVDRADERWQEKMIIKLIKDM